MQLDDTTGDDLPEVVILSGSGRIQLLPMSRCPAVLPRAPGGELHEKPVLRAAAADARNFPRRLLQQNAGLSPGSRGQGL